MTKDEIRAELRRSACEDASPILCRDGAFAEAVRWKDTDKGEFILNMRNSNWRTFFLLVAEAM